MPAGKNAGFTSNPPDHAGGLTAMRKERQRREAEERERERIEFERLAPQGHYTGLLQAELERAQAMYSEGCQLARQLQDAQNQKAGLSADTGLDLNELQKSLTNSNDLIGAISARMAAKEAEYKEALRNLKAVALLCQREVTFQADRAREPMLATATKAVKAILSVSDAKELAERTHGLVALRNVLDIGAGMKVYDTPTLTSL
jgi:hypothetical protein